MSYATAQNLIDEYGADEMRQLTDDAGTGQIDMAALENALVDADVEINSHIAGRCQLPLATVPPLLTRIAKALARYQLYGDRIIPAVQTHRDNAVALLKGISRGDVSLGLDALNQPVPESGGVAYRAAARVFDADGLVDY